MSTIILSALCAIALGAGNVSSPVDTLDIYTVDYQQVKNFDGSQLVGKKVESYKIDVVSVNQTGIVARLHNIITDAAPKDGPKVRVVNNPGPEPVTIIDDKLVEFKNLAELNPNKIESITILKDQSAKVEAEKYGVSAEGGVVLVKTKK